MKNTPESLWDEDLAEQSEEEKRFLKELEANEKMLWELLGEGMWDALQKYEGLLREMDSLPDAEALVTAYRTDALNHKENT